MFKTVNENIWAYDVEWVPDARAGQMLYDTHPDLSEEEVMSVMWRHGGATDDNPKPFLKTVMCRIASIAVVRRRVSATGVALDLLSLPRYPQVNGECGEGMMLKQFLDAVGRRCPQLVGYNSSGADLKILIQRAVINGIAAESFCRRPDKPWEGVDYFARDSEWNIDLMRILGGWGKSTPSLHEMATLSGIPGKLGLDGGDVSRLWLEGDRQRIVDYNECDAITTYLLWLRVAHFAGKFNHDEYEVEQIRVRDLLEHEGGKPGKTHLAEYLAEWDRLLSLCGSRSPATTSSNVSVSVA